VSTPQQIGARRSAFEELGLQQTVEKLIAEICALYGEDSIPWVVGYSGGKDSTATLQLVWTAVTRLPAEARTKPIYVISTDTLVENPVVASWVNNSLETMSSAAEAQQLPIHPNRLVPDVKDTFWVSLIGKGYPAPRPRFRWCTERLKITPSNRFISDVVRENGEAIVVLGVRKAESWARSRVLERLDKQKLRENLRPNTTLPNALVYAPIEDWSNDDVWMYLMQVSNPWGFNNKDLLTMYQGASADGECPLVVDSSTPSCGDSRFGCWTCTLVEQDKSMAAMIQNDEEKEWMLPLLEIRNALDIPNDRHLRDFRRMAGNVVLFNNEPVPGPYTQKSREMWLRKLLNAQKWIRHNGPEYVRDIDLITLEELHEIRRIWVVDKHEIEDLLPLIYQEAMLEPFPGRVLDDSLPIGRSEMMLLREICGDDDIHYALTRDLLDIERRFSTMTRRSGLFPAIEQALHRGFFEDADDAKARALEQRALRISATVDHTGQLSSDDCSDVEADA
jgi:DNA sulfur modification protein DndC